MSSINIARPFSPTIGGINLNEDHEEILISSFKYNYTSNSAKMSANYRILENYPILNNLLLNKFYEFIKESNLNYDNEFIITTSWITKLEKNQRSQIHLHKNSFYSGVYYFEDEYDSDCGNLCLYNPLTQLSDFDLRPPRFNDFNCSSFEIYPSPRRLVLFPSYIQHQIYQNINNKTRHSLAFNIIPIGKYGNGDASYDTKWVT
tara:strand:+ start:640 stop:1251 length:612 start_codon:yes stop_codon:yes gene_type:complete